MRISVDSAITRVAPLTFTLLLGTALAAAGQDARPIFRDGQAQVVPAFSDANAWIREELWVETPFDTDGDGRPDRVHVDVTRPAQTGLGGTARCR